MAIKLLVIDDQEDIRRELLLPWWILQASLMGEPLEVRWEASWPGVGDFHAFNYFSFDNDLGIVGGEKQEVVREMWPLLFEQDKQYLFAGRRALVHSANPVAAPKIAQIINDLGGEAHEMSLEKLIRWTFETPSERFWTPTGS